MNPFNPISSDKQFYIVCYDIVDNKRRTKVMKLLKGYGIHVQKSVFDCFLNHRQAQTMLERLKNIIDSDRDSVRIYRLRQFRKSEVQVLGRGLIPENKQITVI